MSCSESGVSVPSTEAHSLAPTASLMFFLELDPGLWTGLLGVCGTVRRFTGLQVGPVGLQADLFPVLLPSESTSTLVIVIWCLPTRSQGNQIRSTPCPSFLPMLIAYELVWF